ncbi:MAG: Na+/H+ antiporter NhaC [Flavobacteriales bacterium TMED123]|nr:MAG: Na+/H+ antiporter NhaC [Flavobacteriales bacterium TMED123]|tara:strand:- start:2176 stop:3606 length:1431 start_codon:yes stop_codon:yes gene_type:complete
MKDKKIPYFLALAPILLLIILLAYNVFLYADDSLAGANQLALIYAGVCAAIVGLIYGTDWSVIQKSILKNVKDSSLILLLILLIGSLSGTWLISGIIPAMMYYGLKLLSPDVFLVACCIICAIVSLATGSSWSTIATVGIALLGIGQALGFSTGMIGGAVISGAYFGDKMSPMSDTTNVAAAVAETDLFTHIRYMMLTTVPSFLITLVLFLFIGFSVDMQEMQNVNTLLEVLDNNFNINIWLFLVPAILIFLIVKKVAALPSLVIASLLGALFAVIFQPDIITALSAESHFSFKGSYMAIIQAMATDVEIQTDNMLINEILTTGGMYGMLNTVWLIICAMVFSGAMQGAGLLKRITEPIIRHAQSTGSMIATTAGTCVFFNVATSDQYLAIVVPGRMFANTYKEKGLSPANLSRTLEDAGTVTSVLIPWNTCGATQSAVLGVATFAYLPYCFFNIISPFMTIAYAYLGVKIKHLKQ